MDRRKHPRDMGWELVYRCLVDNSHVICSGIERNLPNQPLDPALIMSFPSLPSRRSCNYQATQEKHAIHPHTFSVVYEQSGCIVVSRISGQWCWIRSIEMVILEALCPKVSATPLVATHVRVLTASANPVSTIARWVVLHSSIANYLAESKVYHCGNYLSNNTTKYKRQWRFLENVVPSRGTLLL